MSGFKVGDKVKVVASESDLRGIHVPKELSGRITEIIEIDEDDLIIGEEWYLPADYLEKVDQ